MTNSLKIAVLTAACAFSFSGAFQAQGTTLYSQYLNTGSVNYGVDLVKAVAADGFSLFTPGTVRSISFHTLECCYLTWKGTISYFLSPAATTVLRRRPSRKEVRILISSPTSIAIHRAMQ